MRALPIPKPKPNTNFFKQECMLVDNSLLSKAQYDFFPAKSCLSNLLETLDLITSSLAEGHCADEILLDFSKAFDLVPHRRLIKK